MVRHDPEWIVDELGCRFITFGFSLASNASIGYGRLIYKITPRCWRASREALLSGIRIGLEAEL
jgi:hypothetical protein